MTFLEKFKHDHPNAPIMSYDSYPTPGMCPYSLGYESKKPVCNIGVYGLTCFDCWNREMPHSITLKEKLLKILPNVGILDDGSPFCCPEDIGWNANNCECIHNCSECWNQPYEERFNERS